MTLTAIDVFTSASVSLTYTYAAFGQAVPESATWMMMLVGFGAIGFVMRLKRCDQTASTFRAAKVGAECHAS